MNQALFERLSRVSAEEREILDGCSVDMRLYSDLHTDAVEAEKFLGDARLISIRPHTRFTAFARHRHDYVEIMYVCKGTVKHLVGGSKITVHAGELLLLGRNTWHEILPAGKDDIAVNFLVRPAFFHTAFDLMNEQNILSDFIITSLAGEGNSDEYLYFAVSDFLPIQNLLENLVYSLYNTERSSEKCDELTMGLLFLQLLCAADRAQMGGGTPRTFALRALGYIERHYADATLQGFARLCNIPDYTVSRIIKKQLGSSFQELLQEKRFSVAGRLLRTTDLPASKIIALVGYENTSYFYRSFLKKYGISPQQYRIAQKK